MGLLSRLKEFIFPEPSETQPRYGTPNRPALLFLGSCALLWALAQLLLMDSRAWRDLLPTSRTVEPPVQAAAPGPQPPAAIGRIAGPSSLTWEHLHPLLETLHPFGDFPQGGPQPFLERLRHEAVPRLILVELAADRGGAPARTPDLEALCTSGRLLCATFISAERFEEISRNTRKFHSPSIPSFLIDTRELRALLASHLRQDILEPGLAVDTLALSFGADGSFRWHIQGATPQVETAAATFGYGTASDFGPSSPTPPPPPEIAATGPVPEPGPSRGVGLASLRHPLYNVKNRRKTSLAHWVAQQNRPVLLNFWALWCVPCREEMPLLRDLQARFQEVLFVGLCSSIVDEKAYQDIAKLTGEHGVRFPQYILPGDALQVELSGTLTFPTFALFDRQGQLVDTLVGSILEVPQNKDRLMEFLERNTTPQ